jgi:hypothetical protein
MNHYMPQLYDVLVNASEVTYDTISFLEPYLLEDPTEGTGQFKYLNITNLNPSHGEVSVNGNLLSTYPDGWSFQLSLAEEVTITTTPLSGFRPIWSGNLIIPDNVNSTLFSIVMNSDVDITVDFEPIDAVEYDLTRPGVKERVADIFYKKFFVNNVLTDAQVLAVQTTTRGGFERTGRTEDEQLVFYKKDRNTIENKEDLQGESFNTIVDYIYINELSTDILEDSFSLDIYDYAGDIPEEVLSMEGVVDPKLRNYDITYAPTDDSSFVITIATEIVRYYQPGPEVPASYQPLLHPYFTDALNLSQIVKPKIGKKIDPDKAREILDTNIFELLPIQRTRQDDVDKFFRDFDSLIGDVPTLIDVDEDGAGEFIPDGGAADSGSRISEGDTPTAFITRLDSQANELNEGKTLESMRNELNLYLGDVDNVVQVIPDQRPEYENKSGGFLKIRKPNQAIILRNPNDELEFQKNNSYLADGFTITMWVRFVGKTGGGTLFNFGNPTSAESPYGFRLETITREDDGVYRRMVRLVVRDHREEAKTSELLNGKLYDSSFGRPGYDRYNTITNDVPAYRPGSTDSRFHDYIKVPTDDLNEWFFICATYNPTIMEEFTFNQPGQWNSVPDYLRDKQVWLNHKGLDNTLVGSSMFGAKCKVEVISRSDLLRARGYKVGSLEVNTESL